MLSFRLVLLASGGLLAAAPALAQKTKRAYDPDASGIVFSAGYQVGRWNGGMNNLSTYALELNRTAASVQEPMQWRNDFQGLCFRATVFAEEHLCGGLSWNNRHSIVEGRYTMADGKSYRTQYRVRLNELNIELAASLAHRRIRPGVSADLGLLSVYARTGEGDDTGEWHTFHDGSEGAYFDTGKRDPTAGLTLFCDLAPLGGRGGGPTIRPYYQYQIITSDLFGRYGTFDSHSYQYDAGNYGVALSWGFSTVK